MQRRLAAILAADVVGYSRLIRADEEGTLAAFSALRAEIIDPMIADHHGRVFKLMGDGVLAEFASVVDAVRAAAGLQQAVAERNGALPQDKRIQFRVGINLGDVVIDGDDIHGDGVNVAARLEGLAEPGGIHVSAAVYDQVRDRIDFLFEDLGDHQVKNIDRPVRVWRWVRDIAVPSPRVTDGNELRTLPDKPSIAVLPFNNMSGDPEQEYFADGISEDVITDLSKVSGLFVIARNSSFAYKGRSPDIRNVCRELGVRYVLEGSVRKGGRRVRINAQLIEGASGGHLWAERYDRDLEDIFAVQDDVTREIVQALRVALTDGEQRRRNARGKVDPQAYDLVMRARAEIYKFSLESMERARDLLHKATEMDPGLANAYAWLAAVHCVEYANNWNIAGSNHLDTALTLAQKALAVDPDEPYAYYALALTQMWRRQLNAAQQAAERAIELGPNFAGAYTALGSILEFAGKPLEAIAALDTALRLDPDYDTALQFRGRAHFSLRRYEAAAAIYEERLRKSPRSDMARVFLASTYGHLGQHDDARRIWRELKDLKPSYDPERLLHVFPYTDPAWFDHLMDGLAAADLPS